MHTGEENQIIFYYNFQRNYLWNKTPNADFQACILAKENVLKLTHKDFCTLKPGNHLSENVLVFYANVIKPTGNFLMISFHKVIYKIKKNNN